MAQLQNETVQAERDGTGSEDYHMRQFKKVLEHRAAANRAKDSAWRAVLDARVGTAKYRKLERAAEAAQQVSDSMDALVEDLLRG
jgi:hypothetical protein